MVARLGFGAGWKTAAVYSKGSGKFARLPALIALIRRGCWQERWAGIGFVDKVAEREQTALFFLRGKISKGCRECVLISKQSGHLATCGEQV